MKKIRVKNKVKIFIILLITIITQIYFSKGVNAHVVNDNQYYLCYSDDSYNKLYYDNNLLEIQFAKMLEKNSCPIYSENHEKVGVNPSLRCYIKMESTLKNPYIINILENGFPNKTFQELGCMSPIEAYMVTQVAIYDYYYHYDLDKLEIKDSIKLENNLKKFIIKSRQFNSNESNGIKNKKEITIEEISNDWKKENNEYISKIYTVINSEEIARYMVSVDNKNIYVLNEKNEIQNEFNKGEKFKIVIKNNENIKFNIKISGKINKKTYVKGQDSGNNFLGYIFHNDYIKIEENLIQYYTKQVVEEEIKTPDKTEDETKKIITNIKVNVSKKIIETLPSTGL